MRICLVHQYYKTPQSGGAIRSYYIAKYLTEKGHEVTVITARNNKAYSVDKEDGYEVHNLPIYYSNHLSFLSRIHAFLLFVWSTNRLMKKLPRFDLNYVISTPLSTGLIALKSKKRTKTPYIFEVGDLWPDAPIQLGVIKNPLFKWLTYRFEKKVYRHAQSVVALSPDIKENILAKVPKQKVGVITNLADLKYFNPGKSLKPIEKEKFVIAYLGSMGMANHLEYLVDVAKALSSDTRLQFIIMGEGARHEAIEKKISQEKVNNIQFLPQRDKKGVLELMNEVDAIYVSFLKAPILSSGSPNKFFDGLAAGKLIIINFKGWIKTLIEKHECGFYHDPTQPKDFFELVKPYIERKEKLAEAQQNARILAEQFTPEVQLSQLDEIITL
ncbi:MAG TPA: glycosyltransferase family 4 protein [Fulvivirga sp.]|nr:glycosyltransferase family 4 protein [Fulvivirga sp.]